LFACLLVYLCEAHTGSKQATRDDQQATTLMQITQQQQLHHQQAATKKPVLMLQGSSFLFKICSRELFAGMKKRTKNSTPNITTSSFPESPLNSQHRWQQGSLN
jgi:hypothetical protein